jgi:hypothetical protein
MALLYGVIELKILLNGLCASCRSSDSIKATDRDSFDLRMTL